MKRLDRLPDVGQVDLPDARDHRRGTRHTPHCPRSAELCADSPRPLASEPITAYTFLMSDTLDEEAPVDRSRLLARDYWLINWLPERSTTAADIETHLESHLRWALGLERSGELVMSGPLVSGPR